MGARLKFWICFGTSAGHLKEGHSVESTQSHQSLSHLRFRHASGRLANLAHSITVGQGDPD